MRFPGECNESDYYRYCQLLLKASHKQHLSFFSCIAFNSERCCVSEHLRLRRAVSIVVVAGLGSVSSVLLHATAGDILNLFIFNSLVSIHPLQPCLRVVHVEISTPHESLFSRMVGRYRTCIYRSEFLPTCTVPVISTGKPVRSITINR